MAILTEIRDPRVANVTVTRVEISPDLRNAKVHVSIMGDERQQKLCLHGLENSAGFLQAKINKRVDTRYTPRLKFVLDQGVKKSIEVSRILNEVLADVDDADAPQGSSPPDRDDMEAQQPENPPLDTQESTAPDSPSADAEHHHSIKSQQAELEPPPDATS